MRARLQTAAGDLSSAAGWARERRVSVHDEPEYLREYEHLTLARLLLAQHRAGGGSASSVAGALGLLGRLHAAAAEAGRDGSVLEIRVLQALAHQALGDRSAALAALDRAVGEAPEPDSYARLWLDEGAPMLALLRHVVTTADPAGDRDADGGHREAVRIQARRLLDLAKLPDGGDVPQDSLAGPLSRRELQVLRLLDSELTGPEIARELYVTVNTLRTHTKRIFTKLDVTTRAAAVRRARERGLL
jgi:LuxR family maltose regulon positive regulatory protein